MALSDLRDPQAVEAAMDECDGLGPEAFRRKYKAGSALRYFVVREGVAYDSKAIAAAAHGFEFGKPLDPAEFSGGAATVAPKLRELGFEVVEQPGLQALGRKDVTDTAARSLHVVLEDGLAYLPDAFGEPFTEHPLGQVLVRDVPRALERVVTEPGYKIQGSPGRGRWAATVWVAVFDRLVTTTAQRGYYLVYLFREDGAGVYLSLNQGMTAVHAEVGGRRYLDVLRNRAAVYAGLLNSEDLDGLQLGPLDLGDSGKLTRGYEVGNVAGCFYQSDAVPDDAALNRDLARFLGLYRRLVEANDHIADADTPDATDDVSSSTEPKGGRGSEEAQSALEARQLRWHLRAERNPSLAREAKPGSTALVGGFRPVASLK